MSGEVTCILNAGEAMKPQPVNKLPTAFRAFENIGTVRKAIAIRHSAGL